DEVENGCFPLDHLGVLEYERSDRVDNDSLGIDQFGVSLDSFDETEDRKVFSSDGLSSDLDLSWHVSERGRVDERELFAVFKFFELPSEKRHLPIIVCLCLVLTDKCAILSVDLDPVHQDFSCQYCLASTWASVYEYYSSL